MFQKVLIANRGEIAVRIAQTLREMDIDVVAVYSEPDRIAPHVLAAHEAYLLPGRTSAETYLRGDRIIEIARRCRADAIHPGYGFLAENAAFARSCAEAGVTFIGPSAEAIAAMGDKLTAKAAMEKAGVPVVPGAALAADADARSARAHADRVGYPLLVKAAAGGGGKGMRVVHESNAFEGAFDAARREAAAAFGDARVFLEKFLPRARHIEFQIFGGSDGKALHLFERECSVQRRHQKIIEEAPSPALTAELREKMGAAAVRAADAIGYTNAGTVEFMLDDEGSFYFLEVNTRLQVEHPVTELTVQHDLVRAQILVAAGEAMPFEAGELRQDGHAIECRIYAEDASRDFLPSTGVIEVYEPPSGPGIRVDSGVRAGSEVTVHYDPMLAKLITSGRTRPEAIARMIDALDRFVILGVTTNIDFLRRVLEHDRFQAGELHTRFLEENRIESPAGADVPEEVLIAAALTVAGLGGAARARGGSGRHSLHCDRGDNRADGAARDASSPWRLGGHWRIVG